MKDLPLRIARSALCRDSPLGGPRDLRTWLAQAAEQSRMEVAEVPLSALEGWAADPATGDLRHHSGRFFTVEGLRVEHPEGPVPRWDQPVIEQPEVGILGVLVREFDGVLHLLAQAKVEPGNRDGLQLAPTVQATRSNYTRVHRGRAVPYLEFFREPGPHRVIADVRQSEHGSWFFRKRNRNMVVETAEDVEAAPGFRWVTLGQALASLACDDVVNMDLRSVLACLPFAGRDAAEALGGSGDGFRGALGRSCGAAAEGVYGDAELLHWINAARDRHEVRTRKVPLRELREWRVGDTVISHRSGAFFDVVGVRVRAVGREVGHWSQPVIRPRGTAVVAFVVRRFHGVLHVLVRMRVEPGLVDGAELAPTVQCTPENHAHLPPSARPPFLDDVLRAGPERVRFATVLSEEGGRLHHARGRYLVVEADPRLAYEHPDFRWVTLGQLASLLRHGHYVNVQARSLVACLFGLAAAPSMT